jgi:hypothetical protein
MKDVIEQVAQAICGDDNPENVLEIHRARAHAAIGAYQAALWPPVDFGSRTLTIDRRRMRADAITAHIMHAIGDYLCRHGDVDGAREASRALFKMLYEAGADIVTDLDRSKAGLAPRDHNGLTRDELQIMEMKRIEAMLSPVPPMILSRC